MHHTSPSFWKNYNKLPKEIQEQADKNFKILSEDSQHPSLHFKKIGKYWSVRASIEYRALGTEIVDGIIWFWIGKHDEYERLIRQIKKEN
jgi:mRNA-degrading endonuclease RelE of RelBE toxin-antitoxin system